MNRRDKGYSQMQARTERMHYGVRLGVCILVLMGCSAFMVAALPHQRKLEQMQSNLEEVHMSEDQVLEKVDAKDRELRAIQGDAEYRELIARDRLDYYVPGEHVFRIDR